MATIDDEVVALRLAADRLADSIIQLRVRRSCPQHLAQVGVIILAKAHIDASFDGQTDAIAGRTEIIAHGTTIDPNYYAGKPYYPLTPTEGCLCTKEIWNGKRIESDQEKLVNGLLQAGGANGYCVVIEIDDKNEPVMLKDLMPYLSVKN